MDFIERWLGFSPDNGDGSLEMLILATASAAVVGILVWRRTRRRRVRAADETEHA
jgi:hypothetical protein